MKSPYREASDSAAGERAPAVLSLVAHGRSDESSQVALFKAAALPIVGGVVLGFIHRWGAPIGLVIGAYIAWKGMKQGPRKGVSLAVAEGNLVVRPSREKDPICLTEVRDVNLDTKTIHLVQEGPALVPQARFLSARPGPEVDRARVVIVTRNDGEVLVTKEYLAHMDAVDWMAKIRVFLRKHGWVPEDERGESAKQSKGFPRACGRRGQA